MALPVVDLAGTPREQGRQHGAALRERIARNVAVYFDRFAREGGLPRAAVLDAAERYLEAIGQQNAAYREGMEGIAEGSGFSLPEIAALNVRYEVLYHQYTRAAMQEGCTSFALLPAATTSGHLLMGQNWDWIPEVECAVLRTHDPDGTRTVAFTEAGIFGGKIGLNDAGLGLAVNGLLSTEDDWSRLSRPFHVRCYEILRCRDLDAALRVITDEERACSTNFLLGQAPDRATDVEAAPHACHAIAPEGGVLVHANHFTEPERIGVREPFTDRRPLSCHRHAHLGDLLRERAPVDVPQLQELLRDHRGHPNSLCRHPDPELPEEKRSITVTSVVMDLNEQRLWLTERQPCGGEYQEVGLVAG
jgi:isopenicillin-N N-acyltransferase-like protein